MKLNVIVGKKENVYELICDNGSSLRIVPSFDKDAKVLDFLDGSEISVISKKQSKKTFEKILKDGSKKESHFYNYFLCITGKKAIQIRLYDKDEYNVLDALSVYVKAQ